MKVLISAIVQKMVNSEQSGIMFTINPATNEGKEIVIEAVYGLGEMIVGGKVNPDLYIVDKETREITKIEVKKQETGLFRTKEGKTEERPISTKEQEMQVISNVNVKELARYGKKIEDSCGEEVLRRILGGAEITKAEFKGKYYQKALQVKKFIRNELV